MMHASPEISVERLLAIGDIHGCLDQLQVLLELVDPQASDQLVFLGDYVDRGPDSAGVIDYLLKFKQSYPKTVFLRGNHEQMFLNYLAGNDTGIFLMNGGIETLNSYEEKNWLPVPEPHNDFLNSLSNYFISDEHLFVHAGLRPGVALEEQEEMDLLWIRREFIGSDYDWGKTIVYGHTPLVEPFFTDNRMGLDTGCVYGRQLTCCDVRTRETWQADNADF